MDEQIDISSSRDTMGKYWDKLADLLFTRSQKEKRQSRRKQQEIPTETVPRSMVLKYIECHNKAIPPQTSHETVTATIPATRPTATLVATTDVEPTVTQQEQPALPLLETNITLQPYSSPPPSPNYTTPKAALPRYKREDRSCLSLYPLVEAEGTFKLDDSAAASNGSSSARPSRPSYAGHRRSKSAPLLYEVPQLSQTHGVGRYRVSVNASSDFVDAITRNRADSFSDLLVIAVADVANGGGGSEITPARASRYTGNMDTTSPPPPKRAFSRGNSPVRLAIYGKDAENVVEEELHEQDGKLIFGRRKSRGPTSLSGTGDNTDSGDSSPVEMENVRSVAITPVSKTPSGSPQKLDEPLKRATTTLEKSKPHKRVVGRTARGPIKSKQARLETRVQVPASTKPTVSEKPRVHSIEIVSDITEADIFEYELKGPVSDVVTEVKANKTEKVTKPHSRRVRPVVGTRRATARKQ